MPSTKAVVKTWTAAYACDQKKKDRYQPPPINILTDHTTGAQM